MKIITNTPLVERNRRVATYLFLGTLIVLVGGFVVITWSNLNTILPIGILVLLQAIALPLAFLLTVLSVRVTNNWARMPYPEDVLANNIKGLNDKSALFNYHHLPTRHILMTPHGVFAIVTRWHKGRYANQGDEWKTFRNPFSTFFSLLRMDGIGNPTQDAQQAAAQVRELLKDIAPEADVQPIVVLIDPAADVEITEPDVPVVYGLDKAKPNMTQLMRQYVKSGELTGVTPEQIEAFRAATVG